MKKIFSVQIETVRMAAVEDAGGARYTTIDVPENGKVIADWVGGYRVIVKLFGFKIHEEFKPL